MVVGKNQLPMSTATRIRTRNLSRGRVTPATIAVEQRHSRRPVRLVTPHHLCLRWRNQVWLLQLHLLRVRHHLLPDLTGSHSLFQCFLQVVHSRRMADRKHHLRLSHNRAIASYSTVCGAIQIQTKCHDSNQFILFIYFYNNSKSTLRLYSYHRRRIRFPSWRCHRGHGHTR